MHPAIKIQNLRWMIEATHEFGELPIEFIIEAFSFFSLRWNHRKEDLLVNFYLMKI